LATRAVYTFTGFPETPVRHLYLHLDGYPTGAAWRFAASLREGEPPADFLVAFRRSQPAAEALAGIEAAADATYHYRTLLLTRPDPALAVSCWRRLPGAGGWQLRCGPVAMAVFIQRFLPG
jgi:hypothetical protein